MLSLAIARLVPTCQETDPSYIMTQFISSLKIETERMRMGRNHLGRLIVGTGCLIIVVTLMLAGSHAQQRADQSVAIDNDDVGGVVTSSNGPEAGVWVIAETRELPVRYIKTVVTDDRGRYLVPDLPKAKYSVWVRGYGLVDSPKVTSEPGKQLNLTAMPAPNAAAAAEYYPPIYWLSMAKMPDKGDFPGTGHNGNGINANIK